MMKKTIFGAALLAFFLQSCVIEQDVHFSKDYSGTYKLHFDMSSLNDLGGDSAATEEPMVPPETFDELKTQLETTEGLSNVSSTMNEGVFDLTYDFNGLQALQNANKGENELGGMLKFTQKGKKLLIDMTPPKDFGEGDGGQDMAAVGDMISFKTYMTFDAPVKSVKTKLGTFDKETNSITFEFGMAAMLDDKTNWKTEVRFK